MDEKNEIKTILVIDDNREFLLTLSKYLEKSGYQVISAFDGLEALELIKSATYDLVITDIEIPFISGVGVISALKEKHPTIPAVAITGYGEQPSEAAKEKRADVVLNKPFDLITLSGHIEKLLTVDVPV